MELGGGGATLELVGGHHPTVAWFMQCIKVTVGISRGGTSCGGGGHQGVGALGVVGVFGGEDMET